MASHVSTEPSHDFLRFANQNIVAYQDLKVLHIDQSPSREETTLEYIMPESKHVVYHSMALGSQPFPTTHSPIQFSAALLVTNIPNATTRSHA